jgi:N-formylglutamate deformylase
MDVYTLHRGGAPLLISLPHNGTDLPDDLRPRLTESALRVPDTDWHVDRLYAFAHELDASIIVPRYSRYVIDLNRPPNDVSLYPGQNTTGLCPMQQFSAQPVYRDGMQPDRDEVNRRVNRYWKPYHLALQQELARIKNMHGRAVLWEGHSIRSECPFLFDGRLPDFNLGTASGASCSRSLQDRLEDLLDLQDQYSHAVNGRFKGGYITRQYGRPDDGIDAVQLELAQLNYMDEDTFEYDEEKALPTQMLIRWLLEQCLAGP